MLKYIYIYISLLLLASNKGLKNSLLLPASIGSESLLSPSPGITGTYKQEQYIREQKYSSLHIFIYMGKASNY